MWRRRGAGIEVLLAHPGGPYWRRKDAGAWTLVKGEPEPGEDQAAAARREFVEETGHLAEGPLVELGEVRQRGGKAVRAWALEGDLDPDSVRSNEFEIEWPPGSGRRERFPEIDRVAWFALGEARERINPAQAPLLDRVESLFRQAGEA